MDKTFVMPHLPQCVQCVIRAVEESSDSVQRLCGCLTVVQRSELVALMLQLPSRLTFLSAMLTCHGCMIDGTRVVVLLAC